MITKTITAENQFTQPIYLHRTRKLAFTVEHNVTDPATDLVATLEIQQIIDPDGLNLPNDASSAWFRCGDTFDVTNDPVTKSGGEGGVWIRVGCATGNYTSGEANVTLWTVPTV
jgi:hypothetical protein